MNQKFVERIANGVAEIFKTLMDVNVSLDTIATQKHLRIDGLAAIISILSHYHCTILLSVSDEMAIAITNRLGVKVDVVNEIVHDAIMELVNIIAGRIKTDLYCDGKPAKLGLPTIIEGEYSVTFPKDATWTIASFMSSLGSFELQLLMKEDLKCKH